MSQKEPPQSSQQPEVPRSLQLTPHQQRSSRIYQRCMAVRSYLLAHRDGTTLQTVTLPDTLSNQESAGVWLYEDVALLTELVGLSAAVDLVMPYDEKVPARRTFSPDGSAEYKKLTILRDKVASVEDAPESVITTLSGEAVGEKNTGTPAQLFVRLNEWLEFLEKPVFEAADEKRTSVVLQYAAPKEIPAGNTNPKRLSYDTKYLTVGLEFVEGLESMVQRIHAELATDNPQGLLEAQIAIQRFLKLVRERKCEVREGQIPVGDLPYLQRMSGHLDVSAARPVQSPRRKPPQGGAARENWEGQGE